MNPAPHPRVEAPVNAINAINLSELRSNLLANGWMRWDWSKRYYRDPAIREAGHEVPHGLSGNTLELTRNLPQIALILLDEIERLRQKQLLGTG